MTWEELPVVRENNTRSEVIGSTNSVLTGSAYTPTYTYDKIGNRESSTGISPVSAYTANQLNQYTAIGATNPTYDADGNLTSNGTWTYSWNGENRLRTATKGTTTINFTYDYQGRLVKKDDGTNIQVYVYDGWTKRDSAKMVQAVLAPEGLSERVPTGRERSNRIATFRLQSSNLTLQTAYLWGLDLSGTLQGAGGVGGLLKEGANYPLYDANGNITQKLNGTGTAVMNVDYDPFGNIIRGNLTGDYGFSSKPLINGIDWYYYGFRYYDPVTGRWPSRDPIEEHGGRNLYVFVRNALVNAVDYIGMQDIRGVPRDTIMDQARELHEKGLEDGKEHAYENHHLADGSTISHGPYTSGSSRQVPLSDPNMPSSMREQIQRKADDSGVPSVTDVQVHNHPDPSGSGITTGQNLSDEDGGTHDRVSGGMSREDVKIGDAFNTDIVVVNNQNGDVYHYNPKTDSVTTIGNVKNDPCNRN